MEKTESMGRLIEGPSSYEGSENVSRKNLLCLHSGTVAVTLAR